MSLPLHLIQGYIKLLITFDLGAIVSIEKLREDISNLKQEYYPAKDK